MRSNQTFKKIGLTPMLQSRCFLKQRFDFGSKPK